MPTRILLLLLVCWAAVIPVFAQDHTDLSVVNRIRAEEFDNSQVMDTLAHLSDHYGPRLTGSPEFLEAANWAVERLKSYGLENVHLEKWGPFGRSWSVKQYSVEMLEPRYASLTSAPLAWSMSTDGPVTGEPIVAPVSRGRRSFNIKQAQDDLDKFETKWKGKLKGKIILLSAPEELKPWTGEPFKRYTDAELADMMKAPEPVLKAHFDPAHMEPPDDPDKMRAFFMSMPPSVLDAMFDRFDDLGAQRAKFLHDEGVLGAITYDARSHGGLVFAQSAGSHKAKDPMSPATFVVTAEQYNRIARLIEAKVPVKLRLNLKVDASDHDVDGYNIVGEIPGGAKKDEVVMVGAHYDSWHSGTGATDNGAGSAAMIEVMRILKALDLHLDRTVRIGLWSGEEEGLYGSKAYVKEHFGDPKTMKVTAAHEKFDGYFNIDNGTGKVRGVYLQGNDAMRPLFEQWLSPFRDLGVSAVTIRNTGGTDHLSFDAVGLPGFQFIQDPMDYGSLTHHSDMDTYDHVIPADMMQISAVVASVVYDAANHPSMLPRKTLPKPEPEVKLPEAEPTSSAAASDPSDAQPAKGKHARKQN